MICQPVPGNLDQSLVTAICYADYQVYVVSTSEPLAEADVIPVKFKSNRVGFLIPGQALLSQSQPNNSNPAYAAFSLIAAGRVCRDSWLDKYELVSRELLAASVATIPFVEGDAYLVLQMPTGFSGNYSRLLPSLFHNGVYSFRGNREFCKLSQNPSGVIKLAEAGFDSDYAWKIIWELFPYADEPVLKFFYVYQLIEMLIGADFSSRAATIKDKLNALAPLTITMLRDIVSDFQGSYKELPRLKNVLQPTCGATEQQIEAFLDQVGEDRNGKVFAEKIYKTRNILFHEFSRAHGADNLIGSLSSSLMNYIVEKKFL